MTDCPYETRDETRPCQGSLYRNVKAAGYPIIKDNQLALPMFEMPYAVALTQECDLLQDQENRTELTGTQGGKCDKLLPSILLCPAYQAQQFRNGSHLVEFSRPMEAQNSDRWRLIQQNQNPRYHFLAEWTPYQVPELVVDFKHLFSMPTELLRDEYGKPKHYIARLAPLYREDLSQRFAAYLARIGLPVQHHRVGKPAPVP